MSWKLALWIGIVLVAIGFLYLVRGILLPFVLGYIIAVMLEPMVRKLRARGLGRRPSVYLISLSFFAVFGLIIVQVSPAIGRQLSDLQGSINNIAEFFAEEQPEDNFFKRWNPVVGAQPQGALGYVDNLLENNAATLERLGIPSSRRALVDQYVAPQRENIARAITGFFSGFLEIVANAASRILLLLFTPLFAIFFLLDMDRIKLSTNSFIPANIRRSVLEIFGEVGTVFTNYLRGVTITVLCYTAACAVVLVLLQVPYGFLLALLAGALYLVPYVGAWLSAIGVMLVVGLSGETGNWMFNTGSSWTFGLIATIIVIIINQLFDQFLYPRLVGASVGLSPLISMFVIFCGAALFGLFGMIIAFPLAGAVKVILDRLLRLTANPSPELVSLPAVPLRHRSS